MLKELLERLAIIIVTVIATLALACGIASPPSAVNAAPSQDTTATQTTILAAPESHVNMTPVQAPNTAPADP